MLKCPLCRHFVPNHRQAYALRQEFEDNKSLVRHDICREHKQLKIAKSRRGRRGLFALRPVCPCGKSISVYPAHRLTARRFARRWSMERSCWPVSGTGSPSSVSASPNSWASRAHDAPNVPPDICTRLCVQSLSSLEAPRTRLTQRNPRWVSGHWLGAGRLSRVLLGVGRDKCSAVGHSLGCTMWVCSPLLGGQ